MAATHDGEHDYVLVVDDDEDVRSAVAIFLEGEGYRVAEAPHGEAALAWLRTHADAACVILLDIFMPVMDGFQFQTEQARSEFASIPVIAISADEATAEKSLQLGAVKHMVKPVDLDRLKQYVAQYC